ncbi:hypothetical protein A4H97_16455 [Niastella yeongjuensis]|uniref:Uncharacterized protein n=1 Tax=Niastella yeongjuensis TaxID=354355 RepID=A0A1V9E139_9BACT|nr:hypothetical protein [Niastella yeongjuensis]OQP39812.1 hypothetical protein A4H97_16455 [Niastella yeongjuensis]SEO06291.1 hypothetical protein SAMN05660816_02038 [Niastella yeongjuensis]
MKATKITLAILVVGVVGFCLFQFFRIGPGKTDPQPGTGPNPFAECTKQKIDHLKTAPASCFCIDEYNNIKNDITEYTNANKIDANLNNSLSQLLEFAYTPVFVNQSYFVFKGSEWERSNINIIRTELSRLYRSAFIKNTTTLSGIKDILAKFDEINTFNVEASGFTCNVPITGYAQQFDLASAKNYITRAAGYHALNHYVNHCKSLQKRLEAVPGLMYDKHLTHLRKKVEYCIGKYETQVDMPTYYNTIFRPIFDEFDVFAKSYHTYSVSVEKPLFDLETLKEMMIKEDKAAELYFNNKSKNEKTTTP